MKEMLKGGIDFFYREILIKNNNWQIQKKVKDEKGLRKEKRKKEFVKEESLK